MKIPAHLAIIMDGNGRWAQQNNMPRTMGHKQGVTVLKQIVKESKNIGIPCLTVYAFSTENWARPRTEVDFLMRLFQRTLKQECRELHENNVKIKIIGRIQELKNSLIQEIDNIETMTENNTGIKLNIAFNYGGRAEIIDAVKKIMVENEKAELTEDMFKKYLYNADYPEVELLIRTGGEMRLSNFMLWECAYAEIYVTEKYWPEFSREDLNRAVKVFNERERRFGSIDGAGGN